MKNEKIVLNFDTQKLQAIKIFAPDVYESIEVQLTEHLDKIYQKAVPQTARTYIEEITKTDISVVRGGKKADEKIDQTGAGNHYTV